MCLFLFTPQRLLKSITPEPSGEQHRDFIVTNAIWPNSDQKKVPQLQSYGAPSSGQTAKLQDKGATFHHLCLFSLHFLHLF